MAKNLGNFQITATHTATINGTAQNINTFGPIIAGKVSAFMDVTAVSGTTPSLTLKLQYSYNGTNWTDLTSGAMSAITAAGVRELNGVTWAGAAPYVRYVATISGTTPSFTFNLTIYMHE